jgi:hypothetical protein
VNTAALYPDLRPESYPDLVGNVSAVIHHAGGTVYDGAAYVGKIKLRDSMHFHTSSTEQVVEMFSEVVIRSILSPAAGHEAASSQDVEIDSIRGSEPRYADACSQVEGIEASLLTERMASSSIASSEPSRGAALSAKFAAEAARLLAAQQESLSRKKRRIADEMRAEAVAEEQEALRAASEEATRVARARASTEAREAAKLHAAQTDRAANHILVRTFSKTLIALRFGRLR